jgi:hypothetical protein
LTVNIINLEGSAILGPGSEWFWAMAQLVVVVVTLLAVYRQLQAQGAANAVARADSLFNSFESKQTVLAELQVAMQLRANDSEKLMNQRMVLIAGKFEHLADLHDRRSMTLDDIYDRFGLALQIWWRLLGPVIEATRVSEGEPGYYEGFQRLDRLCSEQARKRGESHAHWLEMPLPKLVEEAVNVYTEKLQLIRDVESDVMPQPLVQPTTTKSA